MKKINNKSLIEILIKRLSKSKQLDEIILATTNNYSDNELSSHIKKLGYRCYRGSEENVFSRYLNAGKRFKAKIIVRITGDCPLVDPKIVDQCIKRFKKNNVDYVSNVFPPTFPDGLDVEVFGLNTLEKLKKVKLNSEDKEHVTKYILENKKFTKQNIFNEKDMSNLRLTVDQKEDFIIIKKLFKYFHPNIYFSFKQIVSCYKKNKKIFLINKSLKRNMGSKISKNQKLWIRAKNIIPGGNMLLSKKPDIFLPNKWPPYYNKAKGCEIWDIDGKKYFDMSTMGVGTNILGYCNNEIDKSVISAIKKSNMSSLNCREELDLAEKLIELHNWADMVKFARTGGEANAIAVRIARAASKNHKIAICGYHGWHDWYLSANLKNKKNLNQHLLSGLKINGVPKSLKGSVFTFQYNDLEGLKKLVRKEKIGIIKMEVIRNFKPKKNFLKKIRELCTKENIILIFDECTTGFRETLGGLHMKYKIYPDMAIFGKALGNGYAITAVIGKEKIMRHAEETFISSTFWTERIGPSAAIKTLNIMKKEKSWDKITKTGKYIISNWKKISKKHKIPIDISGIPSLSTFTFRSKNNLKYRKLITQEMLKKGFLASNTIYVSTAHKKKLLINIYSI